MATLTPFGKLVRKHRIDAGMLLKEMAVAVGRSPAFLSAVESGEKPIPESLINEIGTVLQLDAEGMGELRHAAEMSQQSFKLQIPTTASVMERSVAAMFARNFNNLQQAEIKALHDILVKKRTN